jgi:predicted CopG family antitoxin
MFLCMRTSGLRSEAPTRFNVGAMTKRIEIELPDELYELLERWAAIEEISLSDLIRREVYRNESWTNEQLSARIKAGGPSNASTANMVRYIREARGD